MSSRAKISYGQAGVSGPYVAQAEPGVVTRLVEWLEEEELAALGTLKQLEDSLLIWEWGKWALLGEPRERIAGQLRFRGSRPESTHWDSIPEISDETGLRIDAAITSLGSGRQLMLRRIYEFWQAPHEVAQKMRISDKTFHRWRRKALDDVRKVLTR